MSDEKENSPDWAITLVGRLCLIGWVSMILFECFAFIPWLRQIFLSVGPWICLLALLHSLVFLFLHRQGIFLVFILLTLPPMIYFGIVFRNIAVTQHMEAAIKTPVPDQPVIEKDATP